MSGERDAAILSLVTARTVGQPGTVFLVGAGPGDPGLLTVRARELLGNCDAVVFDALVNPAILEGGALGAGVERHFVGKRGGAASTRQRDITALLLRLAREGKRVVRLKGGDPYVFGRGSEEAQALAAAGIPFEIVPGVTAGIAASAYAGIPVTHRGLATSVTFVTGHEDPDKDAGGTDWAALARAGGTLVLYMGVGQLPRIAGALLAGGLAPDTPAAVIEWGTYPRQRTVTASLVTVAAAAARAGVAAPAITVIGAVAALRAELRWFDVRPLHGKRIIVTRARAQASELSARLAALGAEVIEAPAIRIEPLDPMPLRSALAAVGEYQWIVFTSRNAVEIFWRELFAMEQDARALAGVSVAAVGPATAAALRERGIAADVVPPRVLAEGVAEALAARGQVRGTRILYPRAEGARDALATALRAQGASVTDVVIYRSEPDESGARAAREALAEGGADVITIASASAVRNLVNAVGVESARRARLVSIGPVTSGAARALGLAVYAEAREPTIEALANAVCEGVTRSSP